jgi:crotonobetainyl-CoA:carnitine CoA-transferase CaiB-like acyl-CoA transferase
MRVIELSDCEDAAAYAAKLFGRWGAEVIKVESPQREAPLEPDDRYLNGGKLRMELDLSVSGDRDAFDALIASADVLLTDVPATTVLDLGLLATDGTRPLVRLSITPFGLSGPYRDYEASASTLLALGGYTFLSGDPGRAPLTFPGKYPYYQAGTYAYVAGLAAYLHGLDRGAPAALELSVLETVATLHQFTDVMWTHQRRVRSRHGNRWEDLCPTTLLEVADGWAAVNIVPRFWEPFSYMLGRPELATAPGWAINPERMERCDEIDQLMAETFGDWTRSRFLREGQETWRVPVGIVLSLDELLADPHLADRGFWRPIEGEREDVRTPGSPFQFSDQAPPIERASVPRASTRPKAVLPSAQLASPRIVTGRDPRKPLEGVRIADLTRIWSGPLATRMLGDLGAEVIKVEAPSGRGPAVVPAGAGGYYPGGDPGDRPWNRQGLNNKLNRNKKSVAIDLKSAAGRQAFLGLVAKSDVVIENFSARAMPALKLDYQHLQEANPRVIYVAMPAFGLTGPYRDYVGLGPSIEPLTGMTSFMGYGPDEPRMSVQALTDAMAATAAASAVMTALERRARLGKGSFIELSQEEAGTVFFGEQMLQYQMTGDVPRRIGNSHPTFAPHGVYRCLGSDEWIAIAVRDEAQWRSLCTVANQGWERRDDLASPDGRRQHPQILDKLIEGWTKRQSKAELMTALAESGVAAGAVNSSPEWLADPHLLNRGYFFHTNELDAGPQSYDGSPLTIDGDRGYVEWRRAPGLGEHNTEALGEIVGLASSALEALAADGVIVDHPPS